jgi:rubrerythrin
MKPILRLPAKPQTFNCLGCGGQFTVPAGPTQCPACGYVYVKVKAR